jgi:hypothetical protein
MPTSEHSLYWRGWSESQLAAFQQDQGNSNHCAKYAAASALNLLYGTALAGEDLVRWVNSLILKGTGLYTILGNNNGSLVYQAANLVRRLARQNGLGPLVRSGFGTASDIRDRLKDGGALTIVSVTYFQGKEPLIARGSNTTSSLASTRVLGGHLMILGAYDPGHKNTAGEATPWGFLSSWANKDQLYWMRKDDFRRSWGKLSFYNMITVTM